MLKPILWVGERVGEWWARTSWGWLVIIGPMVCYMALLVGLDVVGLASDQNIYYRPLDPETAFRTGLELDLYSIGGRVTFALTASIYLLVSIFSIVWAFPRILRRVRNPFGGVIGASIAIGASAVLYWSYMSSDYNLRIAFADDLIRLAESRGDMREIDMRFSLFGLTLMDAPTSLGDMLLTVHSIVYLFGNAAPWFLIVFAACCASFEPRRLGSETHKQLRERMALLQISVVLAGLNVVLSVAYLRAMTLWPQKLLVDDLFAEFLVASTPYAAIWGATGTLMLASALAPAYISLTRHFDRIATQELIAEGDDYVSYEERMTWRRKHGLLLSSQQAIATGAAVLAPLFTSPALELGGKGGAEAPAVRYEQRLDVGR